jgi:hypothetical protein
MAPRSKLDKAIIAYIKEHPNATIAEATTGISGDNNYKEVKTLIDNGTLKVHGGTGYHTLTYNDSEESE